MTGTVRATSVYTFHTDDPTALAARLTSLDHSAVQIQDQGDRSVSIRLRGGDTAARSIARVAGHTGLITTGLGIHRREV
jgi:hypothetical protein